MQDFGAALDKKLKSDDKRMVTYDTVVELLETNKKFGFVTGIRCKLMDRNG